MGTAVFKGELEFRESLKPVRGKIDAFDAGAPQKSPEHGPVHGRIVDDKHASGEIPQVRCRVGIRRCVGLDFARRNARHPYGELGSLAEFALNDQAPTHRLHKTAAYRKPESRAVRPVC